jgi:hypothetical protein
MTTKVHGRRPILFFNDECSVCRGVSDWVKRSDAVKNGGRELIDERPIGSDREALARIDPRLDIWELYEKPTVLLPDGSLKRGGEAVGEVLRRLPRTAWVGGLVDAQVAGRRPGQAALNATYELLEAMRPALGCETCGDHPIPWYFKPIAWARKLFAGGSATPEAQPG